MLGWGRLVRRVPTRSQTGQPSQKHSSLCPLAPPSRLPWELSTQSPSAPLPLPGSRLQAGGGRNRAPSLDVLVPSQTPAGLCGSQQGDPVLCPAAPWWVAWRWPSSRGCRVCMGSVPRTPRPRSRHRQCLGHQVPGDAHAAPSVPPGQQRGALAVTGTCFHIWDAGPLASLGSLPRQASPPTYLPLAFNSWNFAKLFFLQHPPPPPRSHHDPMGSTSGAGGGNTDTQRALGPLGGSLCSPAPDFPVPPHLAALPASPGPQASRGGGAETAARGRGRDVPEPQPVGTEGPWCCRGPGGSGCAGEAGPAHQGGGTVSRAQSVLHRETRTRRGGKRLRLCLERV